jgi:hypothetical protein
VAESQSIVWVVTQSGEVPVKIDVSPNGRETLCVDSSNGMPVDGATPRPHVRAERIRCAVRHLAAEGQYLNLIYGGKETPILLPRHISASDDVSPYRGRPKTSGKIDRDRENKKNTAEPEKNASPRLIS